MALVEIDWEPSPRKLRQFGVGLLVFAAVLGALLLRRGRPAGNWVLGIGAALGLLTLAAPAAGRWVYKAWMSVAFVMGTAMSWLLLALLYYGVLTPLAVVFRLLGRDELRLRQAKGDSYWTPIAMPEDKSSFERLF